MFLRGFIAYINVRRAIMQLQTAVKQSSVLAMIHTKYPNYHPLLAIAEIAHNTDDDGLAFMCHKTIAKYVEPELKSLEVKTAVDDSRRVRVSLFEVIEDAQIIAPQLH